MDRVFIDGSTISVEEVNKINNKGYNYTYYNTKSIQPTNKLIDSVMLKGLTGINVLIAMVFDIASYASVPTIVSKSKGFAEIGRTGIGVNLLTSIDSFISEETEDKIHSNENLNKVLANLRNSKGIASSTTTETNDDSTSPSLDSFSNISNTDTSESLPQLLDYSDLVPNPYEKVIYEEYLDNGQPLLSSKKIVPITVEDSAREQGISVKEAILRRNSEVIAMRESLQQKQDSINFGALTGLMEAKERTLGDSETAKELLGF